MKADPLCRFFRGGARLSLLYERRMIMLNPETTCDRAARPIPWDKGKLIGAKPPLLLKHVWSIRSKLRVDGRIRDLAMFNLAIDSKLRGCDVVSIKVEDIAPHGVAVARASLRQRKTGRTVKFELTEQTREALDEYLRAFGRKPGNFLFPSRRYKEHHDTAICTPRLGLDRKYRFGPKFFRDAFTASNEGDSDLPSYGKPAVQHVS
jgi:integrase